MTTAKMTLTLTRGEVERLHEEIGDINQQHVGPKLMELYKRLDSAVNQVWDKGNRKKHHRGEGRGRRAG